MKKHLLFLAFAFSILSFSLQAQTAPKVVAQGFNQGLIGVEVDAAGNIWVTEHGTGNDDGKVTIVDKDGNNTVFMTGLPSTFNIAAGEVAGSFRTIQMANNKVLIVIGEGSHAQSEALLIVDKSTFTPGTPLTLANVEQTIKLGTYVHDQGFLQSDPFNVAADSDGNLYIADAGANSVLKWTKTTGAVSIVKTLTGNPNPLPFGPPVIDPVPTKVLAKPDGSFHVCQLTGFPFLEGAAKVYNLDAATGDLSVHAEGFTCLTDMAFDPKDGNLCVLQFGVFGPVDSTLNFIIGTAAVIKLLPDGSRDTIAQGIGGLAPSFTFDGSGKLYVTDLAFGQVLQYDLLSATDESNIISTSVKAFPNPFSDQLTIEYELKQAARVSLEIYDLSGRRMAGFEEGKKEAGAHSVRWNGAGADAQKAPSGLYVYRLTADQGLTSGIINLVR
ncbi:MAG: ScyD/ScyE family protein [Lewinellaceae bacterium]|nr:ScyD/ScyE family protein [Lewinellaceae bacterium]